MGTVLSLNWRTNLYFSCLWSVSILLILRVPDNSSVAVLHDLSNPQKSADFRDVPRTRQKIPLYKQYIVLVFKICSPERSSSRHQLIIVGCSCLAGANSYAVFTRDITVAWQSHCENAFSARPADVLPRTTLLMLFVTACCLPCWRSGPLLHRTERITHVSPRRSKPYRILNSASSFGNGPLIHYCNNMCFK